MLKKIKVAAAVVIGLLIATILGYAAYQNEQYIQSIESELNVALTQKARVEQELNDTKEQLRISNDQLEKLAMKQESEQALELIEEDAE